MWILENGKPVRLSISVGVADDDKTEISSDKLNENMEVIIEKVGADAEKAAQMRMRMPR